MKKKAILFVIMCFNLFLWLSCTNMNSRMEVREQSIINGLKEYYPDENFYFIYGLDKEKSIATNIKYRGIIYSDRLAELNYPQGLEIGIVSFPVDDLRIHNIAGAYEGMFRHIEYENIGESKAKELFGEKTTFQINWTLTELKYDSMKKILGKKGLERKEKFGSQNTIVNVFVDELEDIDIKEYEAKTRELAEYLYDYMNYVTALQIYVRDNEYFEDYKLVEASVYRPFREREDIKKILGKIKLNEEISEEDKSALIESFNKSIEFYRVSKYKAFKIWTKDINETIEIKNEFLGITDIFYNNKEKTNNE